METTEERRDDNSLKTKEKLLRARHMHNTGLPSFTEMNR